MATAEITKADLLAETKAQKITDLARGMIRLNYEATTFDGDEEWASEHLSKGHLYQLESHESTDAELNAETWIDDRDNDGDLAQSVVNELFKIAKGYQELAEAVAVSLDRKLST